MISLRWNYPTGSYVGFYNPLACSANLIIAKIVNKSYLFESISISRVKSSTNTSLQQPTLLQTIVAIFIAAFMWGMGNVLSRSLLIEGINEIYLVTVRVCLIGSLLFLYYAIFIREGFQSTIFKEATITGSFLCFQLVGLYLHFNIFLQVL